MLNWYKLYETRALFEMVEQHYKTNEGFKQTVAKLENYLSQMNTSKCLGNYSLDTLFNRDKIKV